MPIEITEYDEAGNLNRIYIESHTKRTTSSSAEARIDVVVRDGNTTLFRNAEAHII